MNMKLYNLHTIFDFGRHKGKSIQDIVKKDYSYLSWCIENVEWFALAKEVPPLYIKEFSKRIIDIYINDLLKQKEFHEVNSKNLSKKILGNI